jgi:hypothetical protein
MHPIATARPDTSAVSALLRRYAHFEGEAPPPTPPAPPPPVAPPANNGGNSGEDDEKPIMNSAQLKERLERDREATRKKLLAELGIEDAETDKTLLAEARKRKADERTEAQKAIEALAKEKAKREAAETALATRNAEIAAKERTETLNTAVKDALTKANAKADKVLKLLRADHADLLNAVLKDDGTVDEKKVTAVVEAARKSYPEDFGRGGVGSPSNANGRPPQPGADAAKRASQLNQSRIRG